MRLQLPNVYLCKMSKDFIPIHGMHCWELRVDVHMAEVTLSGFDVWLY